MVERAFLFGPHLEVWMNASRPTSRLWRRSSKRTVDSFDSRAGPDADYDGFFPSATAFVTFTRPTAKVLAENALLAAKPFAMRAEDAPEPRDVIWQNVYVGVDSVRRRQWMVNLGVFALMLFWTSVAAFCATAKELVTLLGYSPTNRFSQGVASVLPVVVLLSILNLLPKIFEIIAVFYERLKAHSDVDLSVVDRFFLFQFINGFLNTRPVLIHIPTGEPV